MFSTKLSTLYTQDVCVLVCVFSVMRRYRTNVSESVTESLTLRTELTDVTLVSEDTYTNETLAIDVTLGDDIRW